MDTGTLIWLIAIVVAYLLGAIPFAYILGKSQGIDIREHGSKNVGATNIGRVIGKKWGMICFALDVLKGLIPVVAYGLIAGIFNLKLQDVIPEAPTHTQQLLWLGVGMAAVLGHMFPVYLQFRGGKGVATGFGAMLGVFPYLTWPALGALAVWLVVVRLTRLVSLASILGAISLPFWAVLACIPYNIDTTTKTDENTIIEALQDVIPFLGLTVVFGLMVILRHKTNIVRLLNGTEPKLDPPAKRKK